MVFGPEPAVPSSRWWPTSIRPGPRRRRATSASPAGARTGARWSPTRGSTWSTSPRRTTSTATSRSRRSRPASRSTARSRSRTPQPRPGRWRRPRRPRRADAGRLQLPQEPGAPYARELIRAGELGAITLFRGTFDQDLQVDPGFPFTWRHERAVAGSGALGDMGSHTLAFAQYLLGDIVEVCGMCETFIRERPLAGSGSGQTARAGRGADPQGRERRRRAVPDALRCGAIGTIGTSRIGTGRKMGLAYEIQGTEGRLVLHPGAHERAQALPPDRPCRPSAATRPSILRPSTRATAPSTRSRATASATTTRRSSRRAS